MARPRRVQRRARRASPGAGAGAGDRVAAEIRNTRQAAGLTQREVAARLNRSPAWISAVEGGRRRIDLAELEEIAHALGMDPLELLRRALHRAPDEP